VLHRALVFGTFMPESLSEERVGRIRVNGELRREGEVEDVPRRILGIAKLLEAVGLGLRAGDRIICGSICSALPAHGDELQVEASGLGALAITIQAERPASTEVSRKSITGSAPC
jgi:2-keto-4-pentenoate hydratase/2-oxohepta-3-ene-1,7-dioic acid hydratase in catechol pathway